jgi:hypothetical protein
MSTTLIGAQFWSWDFWEKPLQGFVLLVMTTVFGVVTAYANRQRDRIISTVKSDPVRFIFSELMYTLSNLCAASGVGVFHHWALRMFQWVLIVWLISLRARLLILTSTVLAFQYSQATTDDENKAINRRARRLEFQYLWFVVVTGIVVYLTLSAKQR